MIESVVKRLAVALDLWRPFVDKGGSCIWSLGDDARESTGKDYGLVHKGEFRNLSGVEALIWLALYTRMECETCPGCKGSKAEHLAGSDLRARYMGSLHRARLDGWRNIYAHTWARPCTDCRVPNAKCPTCRGCGTERRVDKFSDRHVAREFIDRNLVGIWSTVLSTEGKVEVVNSHRDCEACSGSGRCPGKPTGYVETRPWAQHFIDAMGSPCPACDNREPVRSICEWCDKTGHDPDPWRPSNDALLVFSDRLQAEGDPIGEALALWLTQTPCRALGCDDGYQHESGMNGYRVVGPPDGFGWQKFGKDADGSQCWRRKCPWCSGTRLALGEMTPRLANDAMALADALENQA